MISGRMRQWRAGRLRRLGRLAAHERSGGRHRRWRAAGPHDVHRGRPARHPRAPARCRPRRERGAGRARGGARRLPRPVPHCATSPNPATPSPSTTSTCRPPTCGSWRRRGAPCAPGPAALLYAQDKARHATRGSPSSGCRCRAGGARRGRGRRRRSPRSSAASRSSSRPPAAATTAKASGGSKTPPRPRPSCSRGQRRRRTVWSPRSASTSAASWPPWWRAGRPVRSAPTRSSRPCRSTASAARSSPRRAIAPDTAQPAPSR